MILVEMESGLHSVINMKESITSSEATIQQIADFYLFIYLFILFYFIYLFIYLFFFFLQRQAHQRFLSDIQPHYFLDRY